YSPEQLSRLDTFLDLVYKDFTTRAAAGRKMPVERLEALARGRVWTGEDAKARGLVDELGGLSLALTRAKEAAKLPPDSEVNVEEFPRAKHPLEAVVALLRGRTEGENS